MPRNPKNMVCLMTKPDLQLSTYPNFNLLTFIFILSQTRSEPRNPLIA